MAPITEMQSEGFLLTSVGVTDKPVCSKDGDSMTLSVGTNIMRKHVTVNHTDAKTRNEVNNGKLDLEASTPSGTRRIEDESETGPFSFDKPEFSKLFSKRNLGCFGD